MPALAKVVVQPSHAKVALNRRYYGSLEPLGVVSIAGIEIVRLGHVLRPEILDGRVKPQSTGVTGLLRPTCRIAAHSGRTVRRVKVPLLVDVIAVLDLNDSLTEKVRGDQSIKRGSKWVTQALVIGEEVGISS